MGQKHFPTSPNSAELPEAKLASRIKTRVTLWSNAAGWESDQFGTSTSAGQEKSRPGPFSSCGERSFRAQVGKTVPKLIVLCDGVTSRPTCSDLGCQIRPKNCQYNQCTSNSC